MKRIRHALVCILLAFAVVPAAHALELDQAKQQKLVGETDSGYLAAVNGGNAEVDALVQSINAKRRAAYQKLADKYNQPLAEIEKLGAKDALEKTPAGQMIRIGGSWRTK